MRYFHKKLFRISTVLMLSLCFFVYLSSAEEKEKGEITGVTVEEKDGIINAQVRGRGVITLGNLAEHLDDEVLVRNGGTWLLKGKLTIRPTDSSQDVTLHISTPENNWLRLVQENDHPPYLDITGNLIVEGTRVTGWQNNTWDKTQEDGRGYIVVRGRGSSLKLVDAELDHLGHTWQGQANGLTFTGEKIHIENSRIHNLYMVLIHGAAGGIIRDSVFHSISHYLRVEDSKNLTFEGSEFHGFGLSAIQLYRHHPDPRDEYKELQRRNHMTNTNIRIRECIFKDNERFGVYMFGDAHNNIVEDCLFIRNNVGVVIERKSHNNMVLRSKFKDNKTRGVLIANEAHGNIIAGCTIKNSGWHAIAIDDHANWRPCRDNIVIGNLLSGNRIGIVLADKTASTVIQANRIKNTEQYGVYYLRGVEDNKLVDNIWVNNGLDILAVDSTGILRSSGILQPLSIELSGASLVIEENDKPERLLEETESQREKFEI